MDALRRMICWIAMTAEYLQKHAHVVNRDKGVREVLIQVK